MIDINVPKLNNNDTSYVVIDWLVADGRMATPEEPLVVIETSKAQEELACPGGGIVQVLAAVGAQCRPGEVIGHLFDTPEERRAYLARAAPAAAPAAVDPDAPVVTRGARELADVHGLTDDDLRRLGLPIVRRSDVAALVAAPAAESGQPAAESGQPTAAGAGQPPDEDGIQLLSAGQQAVAAAVTESMRTVPAASAYIKVRVDAALALADELSEASGELLGLPELVVLAVARLHRRYPLFFATPLAGGRVRVARAAHVGVTLDAGRGLFVPVVRDAGDRSPREVAAILMEFRMKAVRGQFRAHELDGASIVVALHNDAGVLFAAPIVFPGHSAIVSLGDTQSELVLDDRGQVVARRVVYIGLGYDHRVVNGAAAVAFLGALRGLLEAPAQLTGEEAR